VTGGRVLVTGAGGFVGGALGRGLASLGWQVTALDRAFDAPARAALAGIPLVEADLALSLPPLPAADAIVHAAALTTEPAAAGLTAVAHLEANLRPLMAMLAHAAATRPRAFVVLSSSGVFEPGDGRPDLTDACVPTGLAPYAAAKRAGEALAPAALAGIAEVHVLRLGYILGDGERVRATRARLSLVGQYLAEARAGRPLAFRADDPRRDWTDAADLAPALARLLAGPAAGRPLHLASPHIRRDSEIAAAVAALHPGTTLRPEPAPGPAKPPMIASRIAALEGFGWTTPEAAIARLARAEVPA
jgi:UDP-glucose 4-epimerase